MKLGAILSVMGPTMESPRGLADQARMLVDEGYESLWVPQAIGRGSMLIDPLLALSTAAAVTDRVEDEVVGDGPIECIQEPFG